MTKKLKLLLLPAGGFVIFIIGTIIPLYLSTIRYILITAGVLMILLFYFITLFQVIKAFSRDPSRKIFWMIAIICVPILGNVIYLIFHEMANRLQKPHGIW